MRNLLKVVQDKISPPAISDILNISTWPSQIAEKMKYTPDIWRLEQNQHQLLFVYGDEQSGFRWNPVVKQFSSEQCQGISAFTVDRFSLLKKNLGQLSFPIALEKEFTWLEKLPIKGELYAIKPARQFINLDNFKENGIQFTRRRVDLLIPFRTEYNSLSPKLVESVHHIKAWMYVGNEDYWFWQLKQCSSVKEYTPNNYLLNNYRRFTQLELNAK